MKIINFIRTEKKNQKRKKKLQTNEIESQTEKISQFGYIFASAVPLIVLLHVCHYLVVIFKMWAIFFFFYFLQHIIKMHIIEFYKCGIIISDKQFNKKPHAIHYVVQHFFFLQL